MNLATRLPKVIEDLLLTLMTLFSTSATEVGDLAVIMAMSLRMMLSTYCSASSHATSVGWCRCSTFSSACTNTPRHRCKESSEGPDSAEEVEEAWWCEDDDDDDAGPPLKSKPLAEPEESAPLDEGVCTAGLAWRRGQQQVVE